MAVKGSGNKMIRSGNYLGNISRTKVSNDYDYRATFKSGYLFPIFAQEIYPSFGQSIDCAELVRSITPLGPTMDNLPTKISHICGSSSKDVFLKKLPNLVILGSFLILNTGPLDSLKP